MELPRALVAMHPMAARITDTRHVLIVDGDRVARTSLATALQSNGYRVTTAGHGAGMRLALERARIDLVLIDLKPDEEGLRVCRHLHLFAEVPFIIITPRANDADRIAALETGADDFLVKPPITRELLARMRNILRRAGASGPVSGARARMFRFDGWQLDTVARELRAPDGNRVGVRNSEYRVLSSLLAHGNRVVSRQKLIELARGRDAGPFDRSIDVRVSRLRQLLGDDGRVPRIIKTVHGEGYVIGVPVERA
jgi:two-component system OmpR family response regulator